MANRIPKNTTWFQVFLKKKPHREFFWNISVFGLISVLALIYVASQPNVSSLGYLTKLSSYLGPLINLVGSIAISIAFIAFFFKDLEWQNPRTWGQQAFLGRAGGFVRWLGAALTSWLAGAALVFLLGLFWLTVSEPPSYTQDYKDVLVLIYLWAFFIMTLAVAGVAHIGLSLEAPLLAYLDRNQQYINSVPRVTAIYLLAPMLASVFIWGSGWLADKAFS